MLIKKSGSTMVSTLKILRSLICLLVKDGEPSLKFVDGEKILIGGNKVS